MRAFRLTSLWVMDEPTQFVHGFLEILTDAPTYRFRVIAHLEETSVVEPYGDASFEFSCELEDGRMASGKAKVYRRLTDELRMEGRGPLAGMEHDSFH